MVYKVLTGEDILTKRKSKVIKTCGFERKTTKNFKIQKRWVILTIGSAREEDRTAAAMIRN